jgi:hypothetical protein
VLQDRSTRTYALATACYQPGAAVLSEYLKDQKANALTIFSEGPPLLVGTLHSGKGLSNPNSGDANAMLPPSARPQQLSASRSDLLANKSLVNSAPFQAAVSHRDEIGQWNVGMTKDSLPLQQAEVTLTEKGVEESISPPICQPGIERDSKSISLFSILPIQSLPKEEAPLQVVSGRSAPELATNIGPRFCVVAYFSPDNSNRILNASDNDEDKEAILNEKEVPAFSYSYGLKLGYRIKTKWSVFAGLGFCSAVQQIKPTTVFAEADGDPAPSFTMKTSFGLVDLPNVDMAPHLHDSLMLKSNSKLTLQFVHVPLLVQYTFRQARFGYYAFAGLSLNYLVGQHLIVELPGLGGDRLYAIHEIEGINKIHMSTIAGVGVSFRLSNAIRIHAEPQFRSAVTPLNGVGAVKAYPYSIGLGLGLGYSF